MSALGWLAAAGIAASIAACSAAPSMTPTERREIADSLARQVKAAYDLSKPNVADRMLSLYPPAGPIVSAAGGRMITSRDTLAMGIKAFWDNVGVNMKEPQWIWDQMVVDVLAPNAAVMTATYHIPHLTPRNEPHVIAGAWTAAFEKRGSRWYVVQEHLSDVPSAADTAAQRAAMPGMPMPSAPAARPRAESSATAPRPAKKPD